MSLIPNIPPKLFSFSAVAVGYLLIDDATANEQNAMGNWLMLVAQVLSTNAFYKQVMAERGLDSGPTNSSAGVNTQNTNNSNYSYNKYYNNINFSEDDTKQTIEMLKRMINALNQEIDEIKKSM
ncbi:MAG: hypothetical protein J6B64_00515 [Bacilli bacterium]|nr:hypothetical protein [Bacilli bacterium]MBP3635615.1 hypothetical protein [Bacilli bacterium]